MCPAKLSARKEHVITHKSSGVPPNLAEMTDIQNEKDVLLPTSSTWPIIMPFEFQLKDEIQALDPMTGVWYFGTIIDHVDDEAKVRFKGFSKKTADATVILELIRKPIKERLLNRKTVRIPRLEAERLLKGDEIKYVDEADTVKTSTLIENDPFKGVVKVSNEDQSIQYENLLGLFFEEKEVARKKEPKIKKGKKGANFVSSGASAPTDTEISTMIGCQLPLKIKLTDDERKKVKDKVDKWRDNSTKSETVVTLNKIHLVLKDVHSTLQEIKMDMKKPKARPASEDSDSDHHSTSDRKSDSDIFEESDHTDLFPSFKKCKPSNEDENSCTYPNFQRQNSPETFSDTPLSNTSSSQHPAPQQVQDPPCSQQSGFNQSSSQQLTYCNLSPCNLSPSSHSQQPSFSQSTANQQPSSCFNPPISSPNQQPGFSQSPASQQLGSSFNPSISSPNQQPGFSHSPSTSPFTLHGSLTESYPHSSSLFHSYNGVSYCDDEQFLTSDTIQEILQKSKSSRTAFVSRLTNAIFRVEEV